MSKKNRIIAIDLLGHGQSECLGYIHTMEHQADLVLSILEHLNIQKATLIGHSMGGYVVLAFAEMHPEKLIEMILVNSTAIDDSPERKKMRDRAIKMVKKDYSTFVRLSIANLFSEKNREILVDAIEKVKLEALKTPLQGIIAAQEGMKIRKNRVEVLQNLKIPRLLILSKNDPVLDYSENLKQIEDTSINLVSFNDGHMSTVENREELLQVLIGFIEEVA